MNNKTKYNKWTYYFEYENSKPINFNSFSCPLGLVSKTKDGSTYLERAKENQEKFRSNLSQTTRRKWEHKSEEQKNTINNNKFFYKAREKLSYCLMTILQLNLKLNIN